MITEVKWITNFWMKTCLIRVIVYQNGRSIFVHQSVWASGNNDIHAIDIFQFSIFIEFLTVGELLSGKLGERQNYYLLSQNDFFSFFHTYSKLYSRFGSWWNLSSVTMYLDCCFGSAAAWTCGWLNWNWDLGWLYGWKLDCWCDWNWDCDWNCGAE